ncbi:PREDICTED: protein NLP4 [Nelumbo nucifera]|uniref:Protein NLP4 n=2 Tax=Nelumbo nucifera TaxID=4432 RepID=A0A1U8ASV7_NELNU|nr:PREDICTED: protein NLP4 [Nelumbo nucifera]XP_010266180.1 PREDICTED: protein NLP4 [Nelumbo nucifera]DAD41814.1 TPA_asm: hypothetical protein HUJ06_016137 [Nelumbo nucifera]
MEDGVFPRATTLETVPETTGDFDIMDELLLEGCWLETIDGSDFLQPGSSISTDFFDSSCFSPTPEINTGNMNAIPPKNGQDKTNEPSFPENPPDQFERQTEGAIRIQPEKPNAVEIAESSGRAGSECCSAEANCELSKRWWIGPSSNLGPSVRERLMQALGYIQESTKDSDVLIQIWVPVKRGGKHVLTTDGQPFSLNPSSQRLANYRNVSLSYQFPAEEDSKETIGLPGRVFLGKVPEWTPDVRFFRSDEFPRVDYAQRCDIRGTLALPVFERGSRTCLGVIEVVTTAQKINYRPDVENVCRALQAVDLTSSEVSISSHLKGSSTSYQAVLPEILGVLKAVCETYKLSLAQTWVPCTQQGKGGCRHSDENYAVCVSTVDSACYVTDPQMWGFHEACSEHHLFRGQGVAGRAFTTNQPCFSTDVTAFSKTEYPLSHYARIFGLRAAVAIRLRSISTGSIDYVLEFFLPVDCMGTEEQRVMLNSLSTIVQRVCQSLRVVTDKEIEDEAGFPVHEVAVPSNESPEQKIATGLGSTGFKGSSEEEPSWITHMMESQKKGESFPLIFQKEEPNSEFKITTHWQNPGLVFHQGETFSEYKQHRQDSRPKNVAEPECGGNSSAFGFGERSSSSGGKTGNKRRTKTEKTISLQALRQYFAGSLKDAAKSIGVCPTTLKRICRQHGITRWPSRKIKKVGHSLRKLQVVIDSVQGAEGVFQIGSLYSNFPELTSPNLSGDSPFSTSQLNQDSKPPLTLNTQTDGAISSPLAPASTTKSPSSPCSQSSESSHCISSGKEQHLSAQISGGEDISMAEKAGTVLKRARSDAELHASSQEEEQRPPAKSHSQKSLGEHPNPSLENSLLQLPKTKSGSHVSLSRGVNAIRVKVTYGEEKIRFSLQSTWGFKDIQQEIARRFEIDDTSRIDLKYLDDDSEWVLLTCDADLEECVHVYKSSRTRTIKLSVHRVSHPRSSAG